jgi:hypothetical protein
VRLGPTGKRASGSDELVQRFLEAHAHAFVEQRLGGELLGAGVRAAEAHGADGAVRALDRRVGRHRHEDVVADTPSVCVLEGRTVHVDLVLGARAIEGDEVVATHRDQALGA